MTENEAIKKLKQVYDKTDSIYKSNELDDVFKMAVKALEEIQAYRAIRMVEESKALKEKGATKEEKNYCECGGYISRFDNNRCLRCGAIHAIRN